MGDFLETVGMSEGMKDLPSGKRVFFVGIGGISMSGLARIAVNYGLIVGGSDMHPSERTEELKEVGITVYGGHSADNIKEFAPDIVVHTAAILPGNPELAYAREKGLTVMERSVFLGIH